MMNGRMCSHEQAEREARLAKEKKKEENKLKGMQYQVVRRVLQH